MMMIPEKSKEVKEVSKKQATAHFINTTTSAVIVLGGACSEWGGGLYFSSRRMIKVLPMLYRHQSSSPQKFSDFRFVVQFLNHTDSTLEVGSFFFVSGTLSFKERSQCLAKCTNLVFCVCVCEGRPDQVWDLQF
jgi:hypothetical protein